MLYRFVALSCLTLASAFVHASPTANGNARLPFLPNVYALLRQQPNLPADWKHDIESAASVQREETLLPLGEGALYVGHLGNVVALVLVGPAGQVQDMKFFAARAAGFSISRHQGLVLTIHNHPATSMFYHEPMLVTALNGKLVVNSTEPGWPARHANE